MNLPSSPSPHTTTDGLGLLLDILPARVRHAIAALEDHEELVEVVIDLGRLPEARLGPSRVAVLDTGPVTADDLVEITTRAGEFGRDNRAGIERTLHRISAIRNRKGSVVGLTCRVGRAVLGTLEIIRDVVESGASVLLLGRPGVGKTTLLREAARVLADDAGRRVVIVDTSNEIAGDGDVPNPGIGRARRMQVPSPDAQHAVMIEAVENHMPEVVVIDEISTEAEAFAARTIAERGVQLIATAHGNTLDNLLKNPTLADLVGGIQTVILSDEEAHRRRSQKTVPERRAEPTFSALIEIRERSLLAVYREVAPTVDARLRGLDVQPELRRRSGDGSTEVLQPAAGPLPTPSHRAVAGESGRPDAASDTVNHAWQRAGPLRRRRAQRILPFAVDRRRLERAIHALGVRARLVDSLEEADLLLTIKAQDRRQPRRLRDAQRHGVPIVVLKSNTQAQVEAFLRRSLETEKPDPEVAARITPEVQTAIDQVLDRGLPVPLKPQERSLRRFQHLMIQEAGLTSTSRGQDPFRHIVVFPR